jgi:hypothetical protein
MNKKDIIHMANEAGWSKEYLEFGDVRLERFAKLVALHEREACAKIVLNEAYQYTSPVWAFEIVNDIRARGQA